MDVFISLAYEKKKLSNIVGCQKFGWSRKPKIQKFQTNLRKQIMTILGFPPPGSRNYFVDFIP